jgi:prophage regulatory protein
MAEEIRKPPSVSRLKKVMARTGLSRSTIYARIAEGKFPKSINLGGRAVGWVDDDITDWLEQKIDASSEGGVAP